MAATWVSTMHSDQIQRGHFVLESGLHTDVWLELDSWFVNPANLESRLDELAKQLTQYPITAVCGPLTGGAFVAQSIAARLDVRFYYTERIATGSRSGLFGAVYRLPGGLRHHARGERFAVVDDAISAGSASRATLAELADTGAETLVVGALLLLGDRGARYFAARNIPVVAVGRRELSVWEPRECPLCQAGMAVEPRR